MAGDKIEIDRDGKFHTSYAEITNTSLTLNAVEIIGVIGNKYYKRATLARISFDVKLFYYIHVFTLC